MLHLETHKGVWSRLKTELSVSCSRLHHIFFLLCSVTFHYISLIKTQKLPPKKLKAAGEGYCSEA